MVTRIILAVVGIFAACFMIGAIVAVVVGSRSIPVTDPAAASAQQTAAANTDRSADAVEALATEIPDAVRSASNGGEAVRGDLTKDQVAQLLGVNPAYLTQNPRYSNGWDFSPEAPSPVTLPEGWRADYTDANYAIHSCSDIYEPGVYGPAEITTVAANFWYVPGETGCPPWSTNAQHGGKPDTRFEDDDRSGSDAAPNSSSEDEDSSSVGDDSDVTSPSTPQGWIAMIQTYGSPQSEPDRYGGVVLLVEESFDLPDGFMAEGARKIGEAGGNRKVTPGIWTVYPPYEWRQRLGYAA